MSASRLVFRVFGGRLSDPPHPFMGSERLRARNSKQVKD